jgi:hypothetical protein
VVLIDNKLFGLWIRFGMKKGWISKPVCATHEGTYEFESEESQAEWEEGGDPCVSVLVLLQ